MDKIWSGHRGLRKILREHRVDYSRLDATIDQCGGVEREMFDALLDAIYPTTTRTRQQKRTDLERHADGEQQYRVEAPKLEQNPTARPWGGKAWRWPPRSRRASDWLEIKQSGFC